ncbi:hypothetical protein VPH35_021021 [Triticum aestivum]|uniref:Uncharacterized protein n=1 Tax=Triticum urartu TaxID=4572 RepID=A0A8R7PET7_TRIUA
MFPPGSVEGRQQPQERRSSLPVKIRSSKTKQRMALSLSQPVDQVGGRFSALVDCLVRKSHLPICLTLRSLMRVQRLTTQTMFWPGEIPVCLHQFMSEWIVQEFFTHILLWVISRCRALKKLEVLLIPMLVPMVPIAMSCLIRCFQRRNVLYRNIFTSQMAPARSTHKGSSSEEGT